MLKTTYIFIFFFLFIPFINGSMNDCGCAPVKETGRIVGGFFPKKDSIPYQVYLEIYYKQSSFYVCGGTILNSRYILTAAHCIHNDKQDRIFLPQQIRVFVGLQNICKRLSGLEVSEVIEHPEYERTNFLNDIGLIKTSASMEKLFSDASIMPACLPTNLRKSYRRRTGLASGWGTTIPYKPGVRPPKAPKTCRLKATRLKILNSRDRSCLENTYFRAPDYKKMCTYGKNTGTCQGDSGGPLTVNERGKHVVVGITSYGTGCGYRASIDVLTRVSKYVGWIRENIKDGDCT